MKRFLLLIAALLSTSSSYATQAKPPARTDSMLKPHQRYYTDVFGRWLKDQRILSDAPPSDIPVDDAFISAFKEHLFSNAAILSNYQEFVQLISAGTLSSDSYMVTKSVASPISIAVASLLSDLDNAPEVFVDQLCFSALKSSSLNAQEEKNVITDTIAKQQLALRMLVAHKDPLVENKRLFSVGNRLVDYCFRSPTFQHYINLYKDKKNYPVLRFLNTAVWSTLVGEGWRHWHEDALLALQAAADNGKEIVYVAGGADLYQFLRLGIYNVTVLDPFYPTQDRYYSPGWDYLVASNAKNKGLGDEIICGAECNNVKLVRNHTQEADYFYAKLSNDKVTKIRKSETRWDIVSQDGELLGAFTFKRRPVEQEDLVTNPKKVFVMSYDEMLYIAQPEIIEGWGTDPSKLDDDFSMIIKQFRNPIDKAFLQNIRIAAMLNIYELKFIKFASDPT
jgi:hypothetical protein